LNGRRTGAEGDRVSQSQLGAQRQQPLELGPVADDNGRENLVALPQHVARAQEHVHALLEAEATDDPEHRPLAHGRGRTRNGRRLRERDDRVVDHADLRRVAPPALPVPLGHDHDALRAGGETAVQPVVEAHLGILRRCAMLERDPRQAESGEPQEVDDRRRSVGVGLKHIWRPLAQYRRHASRDVRVERSALRELDVIDAGLLQVPH
jgi:hypothetical protein